MEKNCKSLELKKKLLGYIQASRIEGGMIAVVFLMIGIWYSNNSFLLYESLLGIFGVFFIVNAGSIINYVFDFNVDRVAEKDIGFFKNISKREMIFVSLLFSFFGIFILYFVSFVSFIFSLVLFFVFFIYASPPLRLKTLPPFDCFINGLGFGVIPFFIGWVVNGDFPKDLLIYFVALICGLIVTSYYLFISSFDIDSDKEAGIKTTCTLLGFKNTIYLGVFLFIFAFVISFLLYYSFFELFISIIICLPVVLSLLFKKDIFYVQKSISIVYVLWSSSVLFILSFLSKSIISIVLFIVIILISLQIIVIYSRTKS